MLYRIALGVEYNGSQYSGWQHQKGVKTIQGCLEEAISRVSNEKITIFCAGRTDAGVHAVGQVVHFETTSKRKESSWVMGTNVNLPCDIAVRWCKIVNKNFHARCSAISRRYSYIILNKYYRSAISFNKVTNFYYPLNEKIMHRAAQDLVGEKDFTSFRSTQCQSKTPWRNVFNISVDRQGDYIIVDIKANAFVYRMVRNIIGCLLEIGCYKKNIDWISELLESKDRNKAAITAKPDGLYLFNVEYPKIFNIPQNTIGHVFLP
ncbi:tRNA pseudouridine synthase A [Candidatus Providencia siddallii]|uniref:tRNA pseudouridine synthase A n=1 Tax=Candidatus Providencia siddallii TaxID=1715285 RepID=A0A0M6W801_9GAMM|nr:tRNA pseudouridine synthase A [Candidatus Providencia siddallii]